MEFRIADTFTDSLARLGGEDQKTAKLTAFELQMNQAGAGLSFHKLDHAKDKNFWSVRASGDIRLIVHRTQNSLLICYVDHHDAAYRWAERRKLETHPKTGAAQLVEIRETVQEIIIPQHVIVEEAPPPKLKLFDNMADEALLGYGVPEEWLADVRQADEDSILDLAGHLPQEAANALLVLATGGTPEAPLVTEPITDPFEHPDAQQRFRVMHDIEELERALEFPWDKWTIFLHPAQRQSVEGDYAGPARVSGSAGTGKTVVALHRAVYLARVNEDARVLLTTFSETLANRLRTQLRRLISNEPRLGERIEVHALDAVGLRLYEANIGPVNLASEEKISELLTSAASQIEGHGFSQRFFTAEWAQVVDAWQLMTWESYRDVARLGRRTRLPEAQRSILWSIFEIVRAELAAANLDTLPDMFGRVTEALVASQHRPYDFVVVDEAQDISIAQLRFLAALDGHRNSLFFAGDLGQRIFQQPFSWKALGIDVRGRSRTLRINYRTSHQIRTQADRLLGPEVSDVDGNTETRRGTISIFNGADPEVFSLPTPEQEEAKVGSWLQERREEGVLPDEIAVFVRSAEQLTRAKSAVGQAGLSFHVLDDGDGALGVVSISTMHLAKGLEFRAVVVMACDDDIIPLQKRIEGVTDDVALREVYETEGHLLYVACTRARDHLLVTSGELPSEFLKDLAHPQIKGIG